MNDMKIMEIVGNDIWSCKQIDHIYFFLEFGDNDQQIESYILLFFLLKQKKCLYNNIGQDFGFGLVWFLFQKHKNKGSG